MTSLHFGVGAGKELAGTLNGWIDWHLHPLIFQSKMQLPAAAELWCLWDKVTF